jgi:acyl-CoA synthetase (AMP-forming)/AMP-acid ligase II
VAFTYGLYQLITAMLVGATLVLEKNFVFPYRALQIMVRERVTGFPGVPTMFALLLGLKKLASYDLSSLRYVTNAAAPMPVRQILAVRAAFPQAKFFSMYGQTECKRTCYLPPEELDRRPGSVGIAIPGTEVFIVDEDGNRVPPGTTGELVVRGGHLMRGYWEKPEETAKRLRPCTSAGEMVMYSGDLFRMDEDGFLYFVSREDDIIKSRGEKVSPNEIENALYGMEGVRDVAAIGVPDEILGEAIKVFVVPDDGWTLTERDIRAFCARRLEDFMVPKYVDFLSELPKSDNGKTLRKDLKVCVA